MSYKPDEKDWMAYLYGELEGADKEAMENYLLENSEARKELEQYQQLRGMLGKIEDQEVIAPPIFVGGTDKAPFWNIPYFKTIVSIAASLMLLILAAKFSGLRIGISGNEMRLSFGETAPPQSVVVPETVNENIAHEEGLTEDDIQKMINSALEKNNAMIQTNFRQSQEKLDASIRSNLAANSHKIDQLMREAATASQEQVRQYVVSLQTQNMDQVKNYFELTSGEQKKYMENLLVDFAQYLQQQRTNDLQVVQMQMQSLEQNTNIFKQETEQILTGIISSVRSNGVPIETKN